eukprot:scaffold86711_cov66-Phaeocystis_antarctica.AAC.3
MGCGVFEWRSVTEDTAERLCEREPIANLRELMVHQRKVLRHRVSLPKVERARRIGVGAPVRIDEMVWQAEVEAEEGLIVVLVRIFPHHPLAQAVALPLHAAVLEGRVHHVWLGVHQVRHPRHEERVP